MTFNLKKLSSLFLLAGMMMPAQMYAQDAAVLGTATFEELPLEPESFWNGSDLSGSFTSGSFKFMNSYTPEYASWYGFSYANLTTTDFTGYTDKSQYANVTGGGYNGSANYVMTYVSSFMGKTTMEIVNPAEEGNPLRGFYVTNSACTMEAINNGLAPARAFEQGDWLMLTITEPTTGKKVEYYLADYRSENAADHYALDTWQWVDLSELGNVKTLEFDITGSDNSIYGINTPTYFCMDDFNGKPVINDAMMQILQGEGPQTIDLSSIFTFEDNAATVTYSFEGIDTENKDTKFEVKGSNLIVSGGDAMVKVIVKAVQKGKIQYKSIPVMYFNTATTGTFEDLTLDAESYWNGADLSGAFFTGSYKFKNSYDPQYMSWGGFAYSNVTTTEFIDYADKSAYGNVTGSGHNSDNYGIVNCYAPAYVDLLNADEPREVKGFYVTNSNFAYSSMTKGDGFSQKFEKGDYLLLTVRDTVTDKKVEYYLADFRSENEADHYVLDTWQWVDLSILGPVTSLEFVITGSQNNDWGLLTPGYFCLDDFDGDVEITDAPAQAVKEGEGLELSQFFTLDNSAATVTYTIEAYITNSGVPDFEIKDGCLFINSDFDTECKVLVKAAHRGKTQYVWIPVTFTTSVEGVETSVDVESVYTVDGVRAGNNAKGIKIVRTTDGKVKKVLVK